jgi:hypothetical protein
MYISLGCNCAPALALHMLNIKNETLPFDWIPNTLKIVKMCLYKEFENFNKLEEISILPNFNDELFKFQICYAPTFPKTHINYYNNWYVHDTHLSKEDLVNQINRRVDRLLNLIKSDKELVFIYANEHAIYINEYYLRQSEYYKDLIDIENILKNKYNKHNFKIIAFFINAEYPKTEHITTYNISWDTNNMSDNAEYHNGTFYDPFRQRLVDYLNNIINNS